MPSQDIISQIVQILLPVLATALTALFSWLGVKIKTIYQEKVDSDTKRKIVEDTVRYVQQVYKDCDGKEKLEKAKTTAYAWLEEKGISVYGTELDVLIESAVLGLKTGFASETKTTTVTSGYMQNLDAASTTTETITTTASAEITD